MACLLDDHSYCVGPECELFDFINPNCTENRCGNFIEEKEEDNKESE
jgi:hypothetical protein